MTYSEFLKEFNKGIIHPAYMFVGQEDFLISTGTTALVDKLLLPDQRDFNLSIFYGKEADMLPDALSALPIFVDKRVTLVRQAENLSGAPLEHTMRYLQNPPTDSCLILAIEKIDKRSKFFKDISKAKVTTVECDKLKSSELIRWMNEHCRNLGKELDHEAQTRLAAVNWPNLRDLAAELDRLSLLVGDEKLVRANDIDELGGSSFAFERWKLTESIGSGNGSDAIEVAENLQKWGYRPIQLIFDLQKLLYSLWLIKWHQVHKKMNEVEASLNLHSFVLKKYTGYAAGMSIEAIEDGLLRILEADLNIKRGIMPDDLEIKILVADLTYLVTQKTS